MGTIFLNASCLSYIINSPDSQANRCQSLLALILVPSGKGGFQRLPHTVFSVRGNSKADAMGTVVLEGADRGQLNGQQRGWLPKPLPLK